MGVFEHRPDYAPSPHVTARDTPSGAIVLDMAGGHCWEMNRTGAKMWALLLEHQSAARAVAHVQEVLPEAGERAVTDMMAFVDRLVGLGMMVAIPAASLPDPPQRTSGSGPG